MAEAYLETASADVAKVGIDVGSTDIKAVGIDADGEIVWQSVLAHHGYPEERIKKLQQKVAVDSSKIGITGTLRFSSKPQWIDASFCLNRAVQKCYPKTRNILEVGANHYLLLCCNDKGELLSIRTNPLCAAGTGSFLDSQAARMGINASRLDGMPDEMTPPFIATRCAVFAKSDLIHRQQEGHSIHALWSGLCRGVVDGILNTLTNGQPLIGDTILCGGVACNDTFVKWFQEKVSNHHHLTNLIIPNDAKFMVALGAALVVSDQRRLHSSTSGTNDTRLRGKRKTLQLERSCYILAPTISSRTDKNNNEINIYRTFNGLTQCYLGIDVGSTSTKLVLIDQYQEIILDVYRRTGGDPIEATRCLFNVLLSLADAAKCTLQIIGVGTTGSGRKMIGKIVGSDIILNEISAHVAGAVHFDPNVETIFEIGGQDAKYMRVHKGRIVDANLNYVCAAGTGSFLDELANKLGYQIDEIGDVALGVAPPYTSTRCTVFMEQDLHRLLREGHSPPEVAGAVMYSVIENYLDRVVGNRTISSNRVSFQGATARNPSLVAAIENILGVEVTISPYPHVMGAYGVALKAMTALKGKKTRFKGFGLVNRSVTIEHEICNLCHNRCTLSKADMEDERENPIWGMKCGRNENAQHQRQLLSYRLFDFRKKVIYQKSSILIKNEKSPRVILPRILSAFSLASFWKNFFHFLGIELVIGPHTKKRTLGLGQQLSGAEFCLPMKVAFGHVAQLLVDHPNDYLFVPHLIADYEVERLTQTRFCPYLEIYPSMLASNPNLEGNQMRMISPVIDLRLTDSKNATQLAEALEPIGSYSKRHIKKALREAHKSRRDMENEIVACGVKRLRKIQSDGKPAVVIIGRPYNTLDEIVSHNIPFEIASAGFDVVPMEAIAWKPELLEGEFSNMFWAYGQRIVSTLIQVAASKGLYAVYLSNFACGPDSFILTYAESIMGQKPFLILELDEHGSNGGYQTRLEAFLDVIKSDSHQNFQYNKKWQPLKEPTVPNDIKARRLYIPHMHIVGGNLLAAAIRSAGYNAVALPVENDACFALGKKWTRGSECLPAPLTLGSFLHQLDEMQASGKDPESHCAVFMPTSDGPCRFGQYRTLARLVFNHLGYDNLPILSPSSENAYYDLDAEIFQYILISDILFKMRCCVKPYEKTAGDALATLESQTALAERRIESKQMDSAAFLKQASDAFRRISVRKERLPLVGIVGEIYVRCNNYANGRLVETIEEIGGEVWLSPVSEWIMYAAWIERYRLLAKGISIRDRIRLGLRWNFMVRKEHQLYTEAGKAVSRRREPSIDTIVSQGKRFLPVDFEGESILTIGRALLFKDDGVDLVVNCAPFGCMHGNITSAIFEQQRDEIGLPVVNILYDGHEGNDLLKTFIQAAE